MPLTSSSAVQQCLLIDLCLFQTPMQHSAILLVSLSMQPATAQLAELSSPAAMQKH